MDLRTLRAFVEVVRQGGFSQAAKTIFVTQPTVSKAVRQLEDELGIPLLDRNGHRSAPSPAGDVVYRHATRMLALREELLAELQDLTDLRRGTLRIGLPLIGSSMLFAPLFATYRHRYPGIDIRLTEHGSLQLEDILRAGDIELGASLLPVSDEFEWQPVRSEPLAVLMPATHALARRAAVRLDDLRAEPLVLLESGFALNRIIQQACARRGFEPKVAALRHWCDEIGRDPAEIEWGVGVEPEDLERFLAEDGATLVEMGFTQFTLGFNGPSWSVEAGVPFLGWRDEQNARTPAGVS